MALQSSFYTTDGTTRTFPSTKHIATKQHVAVYLKKVSDSTWELSNSNSYELVNNAVIFIEAPDIAIYSQIEVRVADTAGELENSPSDIAIVAGLASDIELIVDNVNDVNTVATNIGSITTVSGSISNVNTVSGSIGNVNNVSSNIANINISASNIFDINSVATTVVPNIAEILLADNNATIATTQAGIATTKASEASVSATLAQGYANSINPLTIVNKDSDTGAAYIPSGTTAQRPSSPSAGYMRFNTTLSSAEVWNGTMWTPVGGGATGGGADTVFVETSYAVTQNYTITAGKSAITVGDANGNVSIADGVTISIPDSSVWLVQGV